MSERECVIKHLKLIGFREVESNVANYSMWLVHEEYTALTVGTAGPLRWAWLNRQLPVQPQDEKGIKWLMLRVPELWSVLVRAAYGDEPSFGFGDGGWKDMPSLTAPPSL